MSNYSKVFNRINEKFESWELKKWNDYSFNIFCRGTIDKWIYLW